MAAAGGPAVYVGPEESYVGINGAARRLREAVECGGGVLVPAPEEAEAVVFTGSGPSRLREVLAGAVRLVQLPSAGVEAYVEAGVLDDAGGTRTFVSAAGAYSGTVAEHALALLLAGARRLHERARAVGWGRSGAAYGRSLSDSTVVILGAGGIGQALIRMLAPLGANTVAVTRSGREVEGASESVAAEDTANLWPGGGYFVLCAPATGATRKMVGARELAGMHAGAWLVNVARGSLVDTATLVEVLAAGEIAGAALDVTDPEPLPDGHPLWSEPRALITPHSANPPETLMRNLAMRVEENVRRFSAGEPLLAVVDQGAGY